jgi:hypothetical protein
VTNRRGFVGGMNPCRENPRSATHLKMVGWRREEEVAERLGKPASDIEADGQGTVSTSWATRWAGQPDVDSHSKSAVGATNPMRGVPGRETADKVCGIHREGELNLRRGLIEESHLRSWAAPGTPARTSVLRTLSPHREQRTSSSATVLSYKTL